MFKNNGRKLLATAAATALTATVLVSVGIQPAFAVEELTMYAPQAFNVPKNPYEEVAKAFTAKYPQYKIKFTEGSGAGSFGSGLLTALQGGNGADLFKTAPGSGQKDSVLTLAKAGFLADLSDTTAPKSNPAGIASKMGIGKKTYAIGLETTPGAIVANMTTLAADGVNKWPSTYGELLTVCKTLAAKGHALFVWPMGYYDNNNMVAVAIAGSQAYGKDPGFAARRATGKADFANNLGWRNGLGQIVEMYKAGCFLKGGEGATSRDFIDAAFVTPMPKSAAAMFGPGNLSVMLGGLPFMKTQTLRTVPFPGVKASETNVMSDVDYAFSVNAKTKHLKAAKAFINFVASGAGQKVFSAINGGVGLDGSTTLPQYSLVAPLIKAKKTYVNFLSVFTNAAVTDAMNKGMQGLVLGQTQIGKILSAMDRAW